MSEEHNKDELQPSQPAWVRADDLGASRPDLPKQMAVNLSGETKSAIKLEIKDAIKVINQMQAEGVIGRYAIGGAVGATFYLEPVRTLDVDVFVALHPEPGQLIITPKPIYDYLTARGYSAKGEYLMIRNWPVQFLPPTGPLMEEGIKEAREVKVEEVSTFVFTAEHLVAIALQTGRPKDKARILQFIEEKVLDDDRLQGILKRHGLLDRWKRFQQQFFDKEP